MNIIAKIETDFPTKFGVPRQSGMVEQLSGRIIFEPEYRNQDAVRGLEGFSHLWILWKFSEAVREGWTPTVRPPRLGGNRRMGVFATRSPFRPNPIGLSSVKLERIQIDGALGPILHVTGVDMVNQTPIYDIKPYLPHVDCHLDAKGGFADEWKEYHLEVVIAEDLSARVPEGQRELLREVLAQDPRPAYQGDEHRVYGMAFAGMEVKFAVKGNVLTVHSIGTVEK